MVAKASGGARSHKDSNSVPNPRSSRRLHQILYGRVFKGFKGYSLLRLERACTEPQFRK